MQRRMTTPLHPLSKPHLDHLAGLSEASGVAGPEELERRAQELWLEWQKFYFGGVEFTTPGVGGAVETRKFTRCEILWDHATPTLPSALPVMHSVLADRRDGDPVRCGPGLYQVHGEWTWNTFVRCHPQLPASAREDDPANDSARLNAFRAVRRAGDELASLLRGPHTQELAFKGLAKVRLLNGPRPVQAGAWFLRQLVYSARVTFYVAGNDP